MIPDLTAEQQSAVKGVVTDIKKERKLQVSLSGYAGTGKSTCLAVLAEVLKDFAVCAYTGKAADVLRKKGLTASTIHSIIYEPMRLQNGGVDFVLKMPHQIGHAGFIVDEASMVGKEIYADLSSFKLPIVFIGDCGQLEPVGSDINVMANPNYTLTKVHRNAGEIAHFAEHIRHGNVPSSFSASDKVKMTTLNEVSDEMLSTVGQAICAYNKFRVGINSRVRKHLGYEKLVDVGDKIICLRNNKKSGLFNGMQGEVTRVRRGNKFDFVADDYIYEDIRYDHRQFGQEKNVFEFGADTPDPFDYAYCITAHKCVHPSTLIETDEGLIPIESAKPTGMVATPSGKRAYTRVIRNDVPSLALEIITSNYNKIIATPEHGIDVWDNTLGYVRREAASIEEGDIVRLYLGSQIDVEALAKMPVDANADGHPIPTTCTEEAAEWLGLFAAGGVIYKDGFKLIKQSKDVADRFCLLTVDLFGDCPTFNHPVIEASSLRLSRWLTEMGLSSEDKMVPDCILRSPRRIQARFLKGFFADANNMSVIEMQANPSVLDTIRAMLLRQGIVADGHGNTLIIYDGDEALAELAGESRYQVPQYVVPITNEEMKWFREHAGAFLHMNKDLRISKVPAYVSVEMASKVPELAERLRYHHSKVKSIRKVLCPSMCLEVPEGHQFFQNGFSGWNSQGSEWDSVLAFEQECDLWCHKRWAYTVASRAKESLIWVASSRRRYVPTWLK